MSNTLKSVQSRKMKELVTNLLHFLCHVLLPKFAKRTLSGSEFGRTTSFCMELVLPLCPNQDFFMRQCHALHFGEEIWRLTLPSSSPEALSFAETRGKEVSSFEKVLVSAGTDMSGDINVGKEVSEWIWMVPSVTEVLDFLEYVFVGTRTWRYSSKDEEFEEGPPWCWAELECGATVKEVGTPSLSSLVLSPTVKSVSEKCRLQTYCLDSVLACSASQGMPSLSTHGCALCKNGTRRCKNETVIPMISVLYYIVTARWTPYSMCVVLVQNIDQILIYPYSNITHLLKHWL